VLGNHTNPNTSSPACAVAVVRPEDVAPSDADVACAEYRFQYAATELGATTSANLCPNGSPGPCTGDKLVPIDGTTAPVPPCIPDLFGDTPDACMSWEILSTGDVPTCNDTSDDLMQCGCLEPLACGG
jgi:hypothetical protein